MKQFLLLVTLFLTTFFASAQEGILDTSFGTDGATILPYFEEEAILLTMVRVEDYLYAGGYTKESKQDFSIIKMDLSGNLDTGFGDDGLLRFDLNSGFGRCSKILEHPDCGLLAMGWDRNGNKDEYVLLKMDLEGTLDMSYGVEGVASGNWNSSSFAESEIADAVFLSDGRLIAVGRSYNGQNTDFVVACYDVSGNPCSDFGVDGIVTEEFDNEDWEVASEVARDENDNIYVGGNYDNNSVNASVVVKYDKSGVLQTDFGVSGYLEFEIDSGQSRHLGDISLDRNGKLLVSGAMNNGSTYAYVARYDTNGNPDPTFGDGGGVLITGITPAEITDVEVVEGNSIIVAGKTLGFGSKQMIAKLDKNGAMDNSFGTDGITSIFLEFTFNGISEIALHPEGIFAGGYTYGGDYYKFAVTKFTKLTTSTNELLPVSENIYIYPNPTISQMTIESENPFHSIKVFDILGREVYRMDWESSVIKHQIQVDQWGKGMYVVVVEEDSKTSSEQIYIGQ